VPPHQQILAEQVRAAGEEHPVDRPADLLQAGLRVRAGEDHHILGRDPDHQVTRYGTGQVLPERVGQQGAGLHPVQ
jgi:hypothetical protein